MRAGLVVAVIVLLLGSVAALGSGVGSVAAAPFAAADPAVTGNITGPTVVSTGTNATFYFNGTGGPAYSTSGTVVGNISWVATVAGTNTTGVTVSPTSGNLTLTSPAKTTVAVGSVIQTLTLTIELSSKNSSANESTNVTWVFHVVQPYTMTLYLVVGSSSGVAAFNITIFLDGDPVGSLAIPALAAGATYTATFRYASLGLGVGEHTFTASLAQEHGLVTFGSGATSVSEQFYVAGAPPSYTLWYVAGIVAFFGALFIIVTRVAARRRPVTKK